MLLDALKLPNLPLDATPSCYTVLALMAGHDEAVAVRALRCRWPPAGSSRMWDWVLGLHEDAPCLQTRLLQDSVNDLLRPTLVRLVYALQQPQASSAWRGRCAAGGLGRGVWIPGCKPELLSRRLVLL